MKKLLLLSFFCILILFSCSCHTQKYGILSYQENNIEAECTLNGEYKILISKHNDFKKISFLEPSALSYISFEINGGEVLARAGELEIPIDSESVRGIFALSNVFSLSEEFITAASELDGGANMEFSTECGKYTLTLGKNGLPARIQIYDNKYRYDITVDAISVS